MFPTGKPPLARLFSRPSVAFVARVEAHSLVAGERELSVWAWPAAGSAARG